MHIVREITIIAILWILSFFYFLDYIKTCINIADAVTAPAYEGTYRRVLPVINMYLANNSNNVAALIAKGEAIDIDTYIHEPRESIEWYDKALAVDPLNITALIDKGQALINVNDSEAIISFNRVLAIDPSHIEALNQKASALVRLNENEQAVGAFDRVLSFEGNNTFALIGKAKALQKLGKVDDAIELYIDAKGDVVNAYNFEAWMMYGSILEEHGKYEQALATYNLVKKADICNELGDMEIGRIKSRMGFEHNYTETSFGCMSNLHPSAKYWQDPYRGKKFLETFMDTIGKFNNQSFFDSDYEDTPLPPPP